MDSPDRIEEVNAKILDKIVKDEEYVAVLFCKLVPNIVAMTLFRLLTVVVFERVKKMKRLTRNVLT